MGKFFKTAATITETKNFINFLKSRGVSINRYKGTIHPTSYYDAKTKSIFVQKFNEPINSLFHEGGHALVDQSLVKIDRSKGINGDMLLLDERLANSRALDFLKNEKSKKDFKIDASKNYSTYKKFLISDDLDEYVNSDNYIPVLKQLHKKLLLTNQNAKKVTDSTFSLGDQADYAWKFLKKDPTVLKRIKEMSNKEKEQLRLKAWEI